MKKQELLNLLTDINEDGNIDEILKSTDLFKSALSFDNIKPLFTSDEAFKSYLDSEKDKHYAKALTTWKANNLDKIIQAEVQKATNKDETPEQKKIRELEERVNQSEKQRAKAERVAKYKDELAKKKIPSNLTDFILGEDDEVTEANINLFEEAMKSYVDSEVNARLKESKYTPPTSGKSKMSKTEFSKLNLIEKQKLYEENPNIYSELTD